MVHPTRWRIAISVAASLLVLTACGGDGGDGEKGGAGSQSEPAERRSEGSSETPSESAAEPQAPDPADQALAEAALLTLQDFPVEWESAPADDEDDRAGREKIAACVGVDYDELYSDDSAEADSPDFTSENAEEVSHNVSVTCTQFLAASADSSQELSTRDVELPDSWRYSVI